MSALAKYVQGSSAAKAKIGYGTPSDGSLASRPKKSVKTAIVISGWSTAQRRADRRLLVPDLDVAPDEEVQQLAVVPELAQVERSPAPPTPDDHEPLRLEWMQSGESARSCASGYADIRGATR